MSTYHVGYASDSWIKCQGLGPWQCSDAVISKGEFIVGSISQNLSRWAHWRCTSGTTVRKMMATLTAPEELEGFDALLPEDKSRVVEAWNTGRILKEDLSEKSDTATNQNGRYDIQPLSWKLETVPLNSINPNVYERGRDYTSAIQSCDVPLTDVTPDLSNVAQRSPSPATPRRDAITFPPTRPLPPLDFRIPRQRPTAPSASIEAIILAYKENPTSIVGKRFSFDDKKETWEVVDIAYRRDGWSSVTVEVEGDEKRHKFASVVFMSLLRHGAVLSIQG